uniref:FMN-binding protein n=1 Tax=uncultured Cetobacterium sp. TaxID=527638 RepID=UPI0026296DFC
MNKKIIFLLMVGALATMTYSKEKEFIAKGNGFGGEIKLNVVTDGEKIVDLNVISDKETAPVMKRAFPIIKERILKAQSPIVDSVSGATYTSLGVKRAVASAMKEAGKDYGRITIKTKAPEQPVAYLEPINTQLLIVGGGPAGLAAAISAKESGIKN